MKDATTFSASDWLALKEGSARTIFEGSPDQIRELYRKLVRHWHPDRNADPQASDVFVHLKALYGHALALAGGKTAVLNDTSVWVEEVVDHQGHRFRLNAQAQEPFELGTFLRGKATLAYKVGPEHADLFANFAQRTKSLRFASAAMEKQMKPLLPDLHAHPWGTSGGILVLKRDPEAVRLRDVMNHYRRHAAVVPAEHVAWIVSGLFHLACYLEHANIAHHAIGADSVWIVPERHTVHLWGGWFYAKAYGEKLQAMPSEAADMAGHRYLSQKTAAPGIDRSLIRALGRELLGDRRGQRLAATVAPKPLIDALLLPAGASAVEDYRAWKEVLTASFGPPKFVPMAIRSSNLY